MRNFNKAKNFYKNTEKSSIQSQDPIAIVKNMVGELKRSMDKVITSGRVLPGARRDDGGFVHPRIVLDSDKWEHPVHLRPFRISAHCVTVAQYAQFVAAGGYEKGELWSREGRRWLAQGGGANGAPWTWVREEGGATGGGGGGTTCS